MNKTIEYSKKDEHEFRMFKAAKNAELIAGAISTIKASVIAFIISLALYKSVQTLSGKVTEANIFIKFLGDIKFLASMTFGAGGIGYGLNEKRLRKKSVERLSKENEELRREIDKRKGSSNLDNKGNSKKEDL